MLTTQAWSHFNSSFQRQMARTFPNNMTDYEEEFSRLENFRITQVQIQKCSVNHFFQKIIRMCGFLPLEERDTQSEKKGKKEG
jgi:hypothetical protein